MGIIPARAGFTRLGDAAGHSRGDHPRSRGVYGGAGMASAPVPGSSPLARGLPQASSEVACGIRIIPARAGFTGRADGRESTTADHPRSRGVYADCLAWASARAGSSPLARGLPCGGGRCPGPGRIIPARAGFTGLSAEPIRVGEDHPRSRGVYAKAGLPAALSKGSSPLARGLHDGDAPAVALPGIIPARAGFTRPWLSSTKACTDHPRSRGVYRAESAKPARPDGSSPLARGLPPHRTG